MTDLATTRKALAKHRADITRIVGDIETLAEAPLPKVEWGLACVEWIEAMAAEIEKDALSGFASLRAANQRDSNPPSLIVPIRTLPDIDQKSYGVLAAIAGANILPGLAWIAPDAMKQKLLAAIDNTDYTEGPPLADRPARKRKLERALQLAEIAEEQCCRAIEVHTDEFEPRRANARPELVLAWDDDLTEQSKKRAAA